MLKLVKQAQNQWQLGRLISNPVGLVTFLIFNKKFMGILYFLR